MWTCSECGKQVESSYFDDDERICEECADRRDNPVEELSGTVVFDPFFVCATCGDNVVKLCDGDYYCLTCMGHRDVIEKVGGEDES